MTNNARNREKTRERLLEAARRLLQERGFSATSVRDIAALAGVDASLINRYFGSKEGLLTEITLADAGDTSLWEGSLETLGERIAHYVLSKDKSPGVLTVFRSLGKPEVALRYEHELNDRFVVPLAKTLGGRNALIRAGLIVSFLNGLALSLELLNQRSLVDAKRQVLAKHLGTSIQAIVDG